MQSISDGLFEEEEPLAKSCDIDLRSPLDTSCSGDITSCQSIITVHPTVTTPTSSHESRGFDSESFMNKFKEKFLQFVDSHAIATRLEIENVISERTAHIMENSSKSDGNEKLFLHLRRQADPDSIYKLCKVMTSKDGYRNMKRLGQEMKNYLDLLNRQGQH